MSDPTRRYRTTEAARLLETLGYVWLPETQVWKLAPGIPFAELHAAPRGWYERWQTKTGGTLSSSDGFACVVGGGRTVFFNLDMQPQEHYEPSPGYRDRIVFKPTTFKAIAERTYE